MSSATPATHNHREMEDSSTKPSWKTLELKSQQHLNAEDQQPGLIER
jgi:hypothetical protein